jgi:hypothetical protein
MHGRAGKAKKQNQKEVEVMKKVLLVALVVLISVAFVSTVFAQAKPEAKPAEKPAPAPEKAPATAPEKAPATEKAEKAKEAPKPKPAGFVGKVEKIDGNMMMVKSKKEAIGFDVSKPTFKGYKAMGDVKVGDTVVVKYTKDGAMITKIAGAKAEKPAKEKPKAEMKEAPKKEESKPAPAPAKK